MAINILWQPVASIFRAKDGSSWFLQILVSTYQTIQCHAQKYGNKSKTGSNHSDQGLTFLKCEICGYHNIVLRSSIALGCEAEPLGAQNSSLHCKAYHMVKELQSFKTLMCTPQVMWHITQFDSSVQEVRTGMKSDFH
jgi:hypothetical protein